MNIFTKFQPHISKTDIITASKVYCCMSATVCTYIRMTVFLFFVDFFQTNNVLGSFLEFYTMKEPKNMCCIAK